MQIDRKKNFPNYFNWLLLLTITLPPIFYAADKIKDNDDSIVLRGKQFVKPKNNPGEQQIKKEETEKKLIEVADTDECEYYDIEEMFFCKDCASYLTDEQKEAHPSSHKIEKVKVATRLKCSKCKRTFLPDQVEYCPKCKSKLKKEIIEIEEVTQAGEKGEEIYFVDAKTRKKICKKREEIAQQEQTPKDISKSSK
jgi:hypothetical protein